MEYLKWFLSLNYWPSLSYPDLCKMSVWFCGHRNVQFFEYLASFQWNFQFYLFFVFFFFSFAGIIWREYFKSAVTMDTSFCLVCHFSLGLFFTVSSQCYVYWFDVLFFSTWLVLLLIRLVISPLPFSFLFKGNVFMRILIQSYQTRNLTGKIARVYSQMHNRFQGTQ